MKRFRPKTYLFSELSVADGENVEDFVSMQAATADRTAKRRRGRPMGAKMRRDMELCLEEVASMFALGATDQAVAASLAVPVEVISEYRRSLD